MQAFHREQVVSEASPDVDSAQALEEGVAESIGSCRSKSLTRRTHRSRGKCIQILMHAGSLPERVVSEASRDFDSAQVFEEGVAEITDLCRSKSSTQRTQTSRDYIRSGVGIIVNNNINTASKPSHLRERAIPVQRGT